jgi:hypothetical protein
MLALILECYALSISYTYIYKYVIFGHNSYLTNYGQKKSKNNIQGLGLSAKSRYIMCATIVYRRTTNILIGLVCQKLANCTFIPNLRVKTSNF